MTAAKFFPVCAPHSAAGSRTPTLVFLPRQPPRSKTRRVEPTCRQRLQPAHTSHCSSLIGWCQTVLPNHAPASSAPLGYVTAHAHLGTHIGLHPIHSAGEEHPQLGGGPWAWSCQCQGRRVVLGHVGAQQKGDRKKQAWTPLPDSTFLSADFLCSPLNFIVMSTRSACGAILLRLGRPEGEVKEASLDKKETFLAFRMGWGHV